MRLSKLNSRFLILIFTVLLIASGCDWFTEPSDLLPLDRPIKFYFWQDVKYQPRAIGLMLIPNDYNRFEIEAEPRINGSSIEIRIKGLKALPSHGTADYPTPEYCDLGSLQPGDYQLSFIADRTTDLPLNGGNWQVSVTPDSVTFLQETSGWCYTDVLSYQIVPVDLMWGHIHWNMVSDSTLFAAFVDSFAVIGGSSENIPQGNFGLVEFGSEGADNVISPPYFYSSSIMLRFQGDPNSAIELREAFLDNHLVPSSVDPTVFKRPFSVTLHFGIGYKG